MPIADLHPGRSVRAAAEAERPVAGSCGRASEAPPGARHGQRSGSDTRIADARCWPSSSRSSSTAWCSGSSTRSSPSGFMLILGTMEVINFAHGVLFALGGYFALALQPHVGWWGALLLAPLGVGLVGPRARARRPADLRAGPALRPPLHVRRGAGDRGDDPDRVEPAGLHGRRPGVRSRPLPVGIPGLLAVPPPRRGAADPAARPRLVVPGADAVRRDHQGRRRTTARWCARSGSTSPACAACVFALGTAMAGRRRRRSPRRCGA